MRNYVLFVRPNHDDVVAYLFYYSKELVIDSKNKGFSTIDKKEDEANKSVITSIITQKSPSFIMFNGHGNSDIICGHQDEILIEKGVNENLLKNKIIYSLCCSSAAELGLSVSDEDTTFIGYVDDFALGMDINSQTTIHRDKKAKLFLEPSNLLVKLILKGNPVKIAVEKAKELMKKNISILRTDPFPDAKDYIPYLFNNYCILEILGNKEARLAN